MSICRLDEKKSALADLGIKRGFGDKRWTWGQNGDSRIKHGFGNTTRIGQ